MNQFDAFNAVRAELNRAIKKHPPIRTAHEGYGVIREEFEEGWDEIKAKNLEGAKREFIQMAAMAIRFVIDVEVCN